MLYEFRKHNNGINALNLFKYENGDFNIFDDVKTGRPVEFDEDLFLADIETNHPETDHKV